MDERQLAEEVEKSVAWLLEPVLVGIKAWLTGTPEPRAALVMHEVNKRLLFLDGQLAGAERRSPGWLMDQMEPVRAETLAVLERVETKAGVVLGKVRVELVARVLLDGGAGLWGPSANDSAGGGDEGAAGSGEGDPTVEAELLTARRLVAEVVRVEDVGKLGRAWAGALVTSVLRAP